MWLQSGWLGGGGSEGIASVLTWTAPATGQYEISGFFVAGDQPLNSAAVAIVDSLSGTAPLARTVVSNNSTQAFSYQKSYSAGDVVQFQVGNNFSTGNAVGLSATISPFQVGPTSVIIDVPSGTTQTQAQAGYPALTPDIATSVTKTGAGTLVFDAANKIGRAHV